MKTKVIARVQVIVELDLVGDQWNESSTAEQIYREGAQMAIERINKLCERWVRLIGKPSVQMITTSQER